MYSGCEIIFESAGCLSFDNDLARNVIIFDVDNSLSSHAGNPKDELLVLVERCNFWYY